MSKRSITKKKMKEEQQAIGAIYKKYIDTFQEEFDIPRKTFVKSDTLYAEEGCTNQNYEKGQLYNPSPIFKFRKDNTNKVNPSNKKPQHVTKKPSNLKSLGDELKMLQHERQAREVKAIPKTVINPENDHSNSTNLFISNLNPQVTENHLIEIFGSYGPLASVKIMWPRNEAKQSANNCGFVAFMSRIDAERAMTDLSHHRQDMRINWGKSVKIPSYPVHIPSELYKLYSPPPPSGLPFNAQTAAAMAKPDFDENLLKNATIKVTIPFDRNVLMIIHRTIEFVVREGPEFEAILINRESGNPDFSFLTDFQSPAHTYYRWKLYSILNGEPKNCWSGKPFRMYKNGSIWIPPTAPNYKDGMPKELFVKNNKKNLTNAQADKLIALIKNLTMERTSVAYVMAFCLSHINSIEAILELIADSFKNVSTNPLKKVARLYLLSDVVYNCKIRKIPVVKFGEQVCRDVFRNMHDIYKSLKCLQDKDNLKIKVLMVLRAWVFHDLYDVNFITKLENVFLNGNEISEDDDNYSLSDEPLDGTNLLKRSIQTRPDDCIIVEKSYNVKKKVIDIFN